MNFNIETGKNQLSSSVTRNLPGGFAGGPLGSGFTPGILKPSPESRAQRTIGAQVERVYAPAQRNQGADQAIIGSWNIQKQMYRTQVSTDVTVRRNFDIARSFYSKGVESFRKEGMFQSRSSSSLSEIARYTKAMYNEQRMTNATLRNKGVAANTLGGTQWGSVGKVAGAFGSGLGWLSQSVMGVFKKMMSPITNLMSRGGSTLRGTVGGGILGGLGGAALGMPLLGAGIGATLGGGWGGVLNKLAPMLGLATGIGGAIKNYRNKNYLGALTSAAGGGASITPGLGPLVGGGIMSIGGMLGKTGWASQLNSWMGTHIVPMFENVATTLSGLLYKGVRKLAEVVFDVKPADFDRRFEELKTSITTIFIKTHDVFSTMAMELQKRDIVADVKSIVGVIGKAADAARAAMDLISMMSGGRGSEPRVSEKQALLDRPTMLGIPYGPAQYEHPDYLKNRWQQMETNAKEVWAGKQYDMSKAIVARIAQERQMIMPSNVLDRSLLDKNKEEIVKPLSVVIPGYSRWKIIEEGMKRRTAGIKPGDTTSGITNSGTNEVKGKAPSFAADAPKNLMEQLTATSKKYDVPLDWLRRTIMLESKGSPTAVSSTGATGIGQFTKGTGKQYGLFPGGVDMRKDVGLSLEAMGKYGKDIYTGLGKNADPVMAYLAYNVGQGAQADIAKSMKSGEALKEGTVKSMSYQGGYKKGMSAQDFYDMTKKKYEKEGGETTSLEGGEKGGLVGKVEQLLEWFEGKGGSGLMKETTNAIEKAFPALVGMSKGVSIDALLQGNFAEALGIAGPGNPLDAFMQNAMKQVGETLGQQMTSYTNVFSAALDDMPLLKEQLQLHKKSVELQEQGLNKGDGYTLRDMMNPPRDITLESIAGMNR